MIEMFIMLTMVTALLGYFAFTSGHPDDQKSTEQVSDVDQTQDTKKDFPRQSIAGLNVKESHPIGASENIYSPALIRKVQKSLFSLGDSIASSMRIFEGLAKTELYSSKLKIFLEESDARYDYYNYLKEKRSEHIAEARIAEEMSKILELSTSQNIDDGVATKIKEIEFKILEAEFREITIYHKKVKRLQHGLEKTRELIENQKAAE